VERKECKKCHFILRGVCLLLKVAKSEESAACEKFMPQYVSLEAEAEVENESDFGS